MSNNNQMIYSKLGVQLETGIMNPKYLLSGLDFIDALKSYKPVSRIYASKVKDSSINRYFGVAVKGNLPFPTKRIPIIVEKCENGYIDSITGTIFEMEKYKDLSIFPHFVSDQVVEPTELENIIINLTKTEKEEYAMFVASLAKFIDDYGKECQKKQAEKEYNNIKANVFVRNYQKKNNISKDNK